MTLPSASDHSALLLRFLAGKRGLTSDDLKRMHAEAATHADVEFIDASDFGDRGGRRR